MLNLIVEPGKVVLWEEFIKSTPPYSIALDGYVDGPTNYAYEGPWGNFDHHKGSDRLATRSAGMQVYLAITLGLFEQFQKNDKPYANIYVNDADQDVCLSYWLLVNAASVSDMHQNRPINQLILAEDLIDTTAGAYPMKLDNPILRQIGWIYEPYTSARISGQLKEMDGHAMHSLIEEVCDRITQFASGMTDEIDLKTDYEVIGGGPGWKLVYEYGPFARTRLFHEGVPVVVTVQRNSDGTYLYTLGKMSPFIDFPITEILEALNKYEGITNPADAWGGSNIIGGSPRTSGSNLPPEGIEAIINELLENCQ